jgi:Na+/H+ antiporter NhaC
MLKATYSMKEAVDKSANMLQAIRPVLIILAIVFLQALIGKMLWNKVLAPAVTVIKPLKNWYDVIALSLLFNMMNM